MLTLPNILTLSRIVTVPLLAALLWWPEWKLGYGLAFGLYCLMGITDYFDGYLARSSGAVSKLGIFLDPIADKIMVAAVILVLTAQGYLRGPYVGDLHVIAGLIILIREIAVSGLREFLGANAGRLKVTYLAKYKTFAQMFALTVLFAQGVFAHYFVMHTMGMDPGIVLAILEGREADYLGIAWKYYGMIYSLYGGIALLWVAGTLTLITGVDYYLKAVPFLRDTEAP